MRNEMLIHQAEASAELASLANDPTSIGTNVREASARALEQFAEARHRLPAETARAVQILVRWGQAASARRETQQPAEHWYQRAVNLLEAQIRETPDQTAFDMLQGYCQINIGVARVRQGKPARDSFSQAEAVFKRAAERSSDSADTAFCSGMLLSGRSLEKHLIDNDLAGATRLNEEALGAGRRGGETRVAEIGGRGSAMHHRSPVGNIARGACRKRAEDESRR